MPATITSAKKKFFVVRNIPRDRHNRSVRDQFKAACVEDNNVPMNTVVIELIEDYVRRNHNGQDEEVAAESHDELWPWSRPGTHNYIVRNIPSGLHISFKATCVQNGITMNEAIVYLMWEYVYRRNTGKFVLGVRPWSHS